MKRFLICVLCILLALGCFPAVQADGMSTMYYPPVFTAYEKYVSLDMDQVLYAQQYQPDYQETLTFASTRFKVTAMLPTNVKTSDAHLFVYRMDNGQLVYEQSWPKTTGVWDARTRCYRITSDEIVTPYTGNSVTQYQVILTINGITRSVIINRKLIFLTNNTVCACGLRFRDLTKQDIPKAITSKWYMFYPIDLYSLPVNGGTETIPLFASNMYVVGSLQIVRWDDTIYVVPMPDADVNLKNAYVTFFPNLASVSESKLENKYMRKNAFPANSAISIFRDLQGQGAVLMYFSAMIDYDPNSKERIETQYPVRLQNEMLNRLRMFEAGLAEGNG